MAANLWNYHQQTYNSLTDKRAPNAWTQEDGGLIDFEKTYSESLIADISPVEHEIIAKLMIELLISLTITRAEIREIEEE